MKPLDQQFHIAQSRLKRQSIPQFSIELATDDAPSNKQRIAAWGEKRDRVNRDQMGNAHAKVQAPADNNNELAKLFKLIASINDHCAAEADAEMYWPKREIVVTVDESGKTVYAATLEIDSDSLESDACEIRQELEQMVIESEEGRIAA